VRNRGLATGLARAGGNGSRAFSLANGVPQKDFQHGGITCRPHSWAANVTPANLGDRLLLPIEVKREFLRHAR